MTRQRTVLVVGGSSEPAGRGLSGFLVVEEKAPPAVDRDVPLLMQDWRLQDDASLLPFGQTLFAASNGRLGNLITVNGRPVPETRELHRDVDRVAADEGAVDRRTVAVDAVVADRGERQTSHQ